MDSFTPLLCASILLLMWGVSAEENVIEVRVKDTSLMDHVFERIRVPASSFNIDNLPGQLPPGSLRESAPITSSGPARLVLSPASRLHGSPNEKVNVEFLLTNVGRDQRYFAISIQEQSSGSGVIFPTTSFFYSLSEQKPLLFANETRMVVITLRIPSDAAIGTNKTITLEVQPQGITASGAANMLARRFYFSVGKPRALDSTQPQCEVVENNLVDQCKEVANTPDQCDQYKWVGRIVVMDTDSGLRSLQEMPALEGELTNLAFFSYDNFVIGSRLPATFFVQASCCLPSIALRIDDVAGNEKVCTVGLTAGDLNGNLQLGTLGIVTIVVVVVLVLVVIGAILVIFYIRRKRAVELEEMRATPQAR